MARGRATACCLLGTAALLALAVAPVTAAAPESVLVITGKGWGHGVGMAQDGALRMGQDGDSVGQILVQFYPGTTIGNASGDVRVAVLDAGPAPASVEVDFPDGGQVVDGLTTPHAAGFPRPVPAGGSALFTWDGTTYTVTTTPVVTRAAMRAAPSPTQAAMRAAPTTTAPAHPTTTAPTGIGRLLPLLPMPTTTTTTRPRPSTTTSIRPTTTSTSTSSTTLPATASTPPLSSSAPLWALPPPGGMLSVPARGRSYRGDIEAIGSSGSLGLINQLDVETYLTGMGEVLDPAWPMASLETQEIAARTYALRAMATGGQLCDDTRCQVYLGTAGEYAAAEAAVAATRGVVLLSAGQLADTVYSANAAGYSASPLEGFGTVVSDEPYLRAAPYPAGPAFDWSLTVSAAQAGALLGLPGPLTAATVTQRGPSDRALAVTVTAGTTSASVSGLQFAAALDLRSTLFSLQMSQSASPVAPITGGSGLQVPPEQAAGQAPAVAAAGAAAGDGLTGDGLARAGRRHHVRVEALPVERLTVHRPGAGVPVALGALALMLVALVGAAMIRLGRTPRSSGIQ
jgi:SpoIID/LytB domain protein